MSERREMTKRWDMTGRERVVVSIAALAVTFAAGVVFATDHEDGHSVPAGVGFSGWLADADGKALTGEVLLLVGVYGEPTGGEAVEMFTLPNVEVDQGKFSITLTSVSEDTNLWDGSTRWVEVTVDGDKLKPRTAIVSTPYALRAGVATKLTDAARADVLADAEARIAALEAKLASVTVSENGEDVYFTKVNVHVRDGSGNTLGVIPSNNDEEGDDIDPEDHSFRGSGLGNLIVGYNEEIGGEDRTGQHNLVVGVGHSYSSYASIIAGYNNNGEGHSAALLGGWQNSTEDAGAVTVGGKENEAHANGAVAIGGEKNKSDSQQTVTVGGESNLSNHNNAVVVGGKDNAVKRENDQNSNAVSTGEGSVIVGGQNNDIASSPGLSAKFAVIVGGDSNAIEGSVVGNSGSDEVTGAVVVGGSDNKASAKGAVQVGGIGSINAAENTGSVSAD